MREGSELHHEPQTASLSWSKVTQEISVRSAQRVNILETMEMGWKSSGNCCVAWKTVKSPTVETNRQWLMRYKPADDDDDVRRHRTGVQEKPKLRCKGFGSERGRPNHPPEKGWIGCD